MKRSLALFIGAWALGLARALALDPRQYCVEVNCQAQTAPPALIFSWPQVDYARQYWIRRKTLADHDWSAPLANPAGDSTGFTDRNVEPGNAYEYEIQMETTAPAYEGGWISAYTYIYGGIQASLADFKGKVLLLAESSIAAQLEPEISLFAQDLVGAGYSVIRRTAASSAAVPDVKNLIRTEYMADPGAFRTVVLIGHLPVPSSGNFAPDLHESHRGAWPADAYYADLDGTWTDSSVSTPGGSDYPEESNYPGDGKFDQSEIPGTIRLELGRIDFHDLPAFAPRTEMDLLKAYFRKDHAFRHRQFTAARRAILHDNFGDLDGDAPAVDAWRHFTGFFGPGAIRTAGPYEFFPTLASESFLWSYGCGGGEMTQADGVGSTTDFVQGDPKTVFLMLHGSYFGDWNFTDNFLRSALGSPSMTLAAVWSGIPHWYLHHMALGQTIGFSTRVSQNNRSTYKSYKNFFPAGVHTALMGDPTLELFPVIPPANLTASAGASVQLNWNPSPDSDLLGYHVYCAPAAEGPYTRLTATPQTSTQFTHFNGPGTYFYMVRAVKLETTGSGTFYNASQGIFASMTNSNSGGTTIPEVSIAVLDSIASENGPDEGSFIVTRPAVSDSPLEVHLLLGGTAQNGVDYQTLDSTVTIPPGAASATIQIRPIPDDAMEGDETVTVQLGLSSDYKPGALPSAVLFIKDHPNQPPAISTIGDLTIISGHSSGDIAFTISDAETPADSLVLHAASSDETVIPLSAMVFGGSGGNRTLKITSPATQSGSARIQILVSDGVQETSSAFTITIKANHPPIADNLDLYTPKSLIIPIAELLSGATDPDGDLLHIESVNTNTLIHGNLRMDDATLTYTPSDGFSGIDLFSCIVADSFGGTRFRQVTIHVNVPSKISSFALDGSTLSLFITGPPNSRFQVECSTSAFTWKILGEGTSDTKGNAVFHDAENGVRMKLYRVQWH